MPNFHLAQINIAHAIAPMESDVMEGFVSRIDEINALADKADGFVWRLQEEAGNATGIQAYDDPNVVVNISVWQSLDYLKNFVYQTAHRELIKDRGLWFKQNMLSHLALWWIPEGCLPSLEEAKSKLILLDTMGPSADAFTFAKPFAPINHSS